MGAAFPEFRAAYERVVVPSVAPDERYGLLDEMLRQAQDEGVLSELPRSEEEASNAAAQIVRYRTVASYLHMLGYLERKPLKDDGPDEVCDDAWRAAVRAFQDDAGIRLKSDGWVGSHTWNALRALVGFESETRVTHWFVDGRPLPVLQRAAQLRLFTLGLADASPGRDFAGLADGACDRLVFVARVMGLLPAGAGPAGDVALISLLFDQDALVAGAASLRASGDGHMFQFDGYDESVRGGVGKSVTLERFRVFLVCLAKVELWLLGFEAVPDGKANYPVGGCPEEDATGRPGKLLGNSLEKFWKEYLGYGPNEARFHSRYVTPALFRELQNAMALGPVAADPAGETDATRAVLDHFRDDGAIAKAWRTVKRMGSRLWDGVRRVWNWLKRGVSRLIALGRNLEKGLFRFASKAYRYVRDVVRTVREGLEFYVRQVVPGSSLDTVIVGIDTDLDTTVFVRDGCPPEAIRDVSASLVWHSRAFLIGGEILQRIGTLLLETVLTGWAGLIRFLVKRLGSLRRLGASVEDLWSRRPAFLDA